MRGNGENKSPSEKKMKPDWKGNGAKKSLLDEKYEEGILQSKISDFSASILLKRNDHP